MSAPIEGKYKDLFKLDFFFTRILEDLELARIKTNDLFLNADAGFDSKKFRALCFEKDIMANIDFNKKSKSTGNQMLIDDKLYDERFLLKDRMLGFMPLKPY